MKKIVDAFSEIEAKQSVLLGNIKNLHLKTATTITKIFQLKNSLKRLEVKERNNLSIKFEILYITAELWFSGRVISVIRRKEKIFSAPILQVDINIVLELADNGRNQTDWDASFICLSAHGIGSVRIYYLPVTFIVNPERTALRNSPRTIFFLARLRIYWKRNASAFKRKPKPTRQRNSLLSTEATMREIN